MNTSTSQIAEASADTTASTNAKTRIDAAWVGTSSSGAANGLVRVLTWPLKALLLRVLNRLLRGVDTGIISVALPNGQIAEGRGAKPGPQGIIKIRRWRALWRLTVQGDIGLAESYRDGDWETPDLTAVLEAGARNDANFGDMLDASWPARAATRLYHLARSNTKRGSRQNIAFHYDLGNDFYAQWLDPQMVYSSALYRGDPSMTGETLEHAQSTKLDRIVDLLDVAPGANVLEIGCGWGALAMALAGRCQANVTGLTLSQEQLAYAQARVCAERLDSRIDLRLQDYRDADGQYDAIVSIEMLEAVGEKYWPTYFATLRDRLRPGGKAVVQVITIADEHFDHYRSTPDFIQRFIFPGGMLPSPASMQAEAEQAGLTLTLAESFGDGYAATLVEWRNRFLRAWPNIETLGFDARFRRLWEYYLSYCEAGFRTKRVDVKLYVLSRA